MSEQVEVKSVAKKRVWKPEWNENRKNKKRASSRLSDSGAAIKPKDAKKILADQRGLRNPRVIEVCVELAQTAARSLQIPFNVHLFTHGVQKTLEAREKKVEPPVIEDVWKAGERIREHELYALWDYSTSWRTQPDGTQLSFENWKAYRRRCVTDIVWFANTVLGKSFEQEPHGRWATELFPQLESALLSLPEDFGQKDVARAFRTLSDVRQRCLIAARSSFKSTFSTVFMLALMLCFAGSLRILVCTSTVPLARGFARSFRSLLTLRDPNNPTLFNQLWPEHCIAPDEGKSLEYTSPFRQLDALIEPTLFITSVISEGQAGSRYDYGDFDDCAEISNSSTPEMRAKTQERIDLLRELGEPHALTTFVGTPVSCGCGTDEDPGDLYSVLLRREEKNQKDGGEPKLLYAICPAWTVKTGVNKKAWDATLTEDEVNLLFPARLSFKYLMAKLKEDLATDKSARIFRQQSLVSWVPDVEEGLRVTFDHDTLWHRVRPAAYFTNASFVSQTILGMDRAYGQSRFADMSCLLLARRQQVIQTDGSRKDALVFADCRMDRWRESDLIRNIVEMIIKHRPTIFVAEQDKNWQEVWDAVRHQCVARSIPAPFFRWKQIDTSNKSFARRAKQMELPITDGRIWFVGADWAEAVLNQFEKFDGITNSNSHRKDDAVACASLIHQECGVKYTEEPKQEDTQTEKDAAEREAAQARLRAQHDRMFSNAYMPPAQKVSEWQRLQRSQPQQPEQSQPANSRFARLPAGWR